MSALLIKFLSICLIGISWLVIVLNFHNNACTSFGAYHIWFFSDKCYYNPDVLSDVPSMAERHNYQSESYNVTTDDEYILTLFRISSRGVGDAKPNAKSPVFIQHGITTDSGPWVDIGNRSLAFNLADLGYDVWLGNVRGSTYSNKNVNLTVWNSKFWNFSLDTLAQKDISAQLNLVANVTGKAGYIIYIGHSMGSTLAFMYTSAYPEEAQKFIQGIVALSPVVYLNNVRLLELGRSIGLPFFLESLGKIGIKGLFYEEKIIRTFLTNLCKVIPELCHWFLNLVFGKTVQFEPKDLLLYYSYWPSGTSVYQLIQYLQLSKSGKFQKFDYGEEGNLKAYGTDEPPIYNLTNIKIPVHLYYGQCDSLYNEANLDRLVNELGSTDKTKYKVPAKDDQYCFDHIDFMYAEFLNEYLYQDLFEVLETEFK